MFLGQQEMGMWLELGELGSARHGKGREVDGEVGRARPHWTSGAQGSGWGLSPLAVGSRAVACRHRSLRE